MLNKDFYTFNDQKFEQSAKIANTHCGKFSEWTIVSMMCDCMSQNNKNESLNIKNN